MYHEPFAKNKNIPLIEHDLDILRFKYFGYYKICKLILKIEEIKKIK